MKILVISSCSSTQEHPHLSNKLGPHDFNPPDHLARRMKELWKYKASAAKMYKGDEHLYVMKGLGKIRDRYGRAAIDLSIISTGYGLINECTVIVPYDVPLKESHVLLQESDRLHKSVEDLTADYDLVFFFLGQQYYNALKLYKRPFQVPDTVTQIFLIVKRTTGYKHLISHQLRNCCAVELNSAEFGSTYIAKGRVFKKLCEAARREGLHVFEEVRRNPQQILKIARRACNRS